MAKQKLLRFAEMENFSNVLQDPYHLKGKWHSDYFKNTNPIVLELGCGKGDYTINLARRFPMKNFIGIDIKGARLWVGAKTALEEKLTNVVFLRLPIEKIEQLFDKDEIEEIWIPFADPFPKISKAKKRLTSPKFLSAYKNFVKKDSLIHFKTDDADFFQYTLEILEEKECLIHESIKDLQYPPDDDSPIYIQTTYEKQHIKNGEKINYVCFSLKA